jgi:hypothetical protein
MSNFTDFISSGGGATLETVILTTSQTWTPPVDGTGIIHVIGAGASGTSDSSQVRSGGAGGYSRKAVTFATGTNWTIVVGAGGMPTNYNQVVIAGGNSTASDGSSSLTANGAGTTGTGGTASGGDVNFTGGIGGSGGSTLNRIGGGGAVGVFANGSTSASRVGGATTDANGGAENVLVLGLGQLIGGVGGSAGQCGQNGGFLSGGGAGRSDSGTDMCTGGSGGIGGGGGMGYNGANAALRFGGRGGDGLVVIQYLTVT